MTVIRTGATRAGGSSRIAVAIAVAALLAGGLALASGSAVWVGCLLTAAAVSCGVLILVRHASEKVAFTGAAIGITAIAALLLVATVSILP